MSGLLSSDNPYSCRDEIEKWLAWDTAWHRLALEVADRRAVPGKPKMTADEASRYMLHAMWDSAKRSQETNMSRMSEMSAAMREHCNENYSPEDEFYDLEEMEHRPRLVWTCADANCSGEVALSKGLHPSHCPHCQGKAFYMPSDEDQA